MTVKVGLKTGVFGGDSNEESLKTLGDAYDKAHGCWLQLSGKNCVAGKEYSIYCAQVLVVR